MLQHLQEANTIHKDTAILSMMNGLGHEERLSKISAIISNLSSRNDVDSRFKRPRTATFRR